MISKFSYTNEINIWMGFHNQLGYFANIAMQGRLTNQFSLKKLPLASLYFSHFPPVKNVQIQNADKSMKNS